MKRCLKVLILSILALASRSAVACDVFSLLDIDDTTNETKKWPCGTSLGFASGVTALPSGWLTGPISTAAVAWDNAASKLSIAQANTKKVYWVVVGANENWPGDSNAPGYTDQGPTRTMTDAIVYLNFKNFVPANYYSGTDCPPSTQVSVLRVALHEWGHAIGLRHASVCGGNVMDDGVQFGDCTIALGPLDTGAAAALYGCTVQDRLNLQVGESCGCYSGLPDVAVRDFACVDGL